MLHHFGPKLRYLRLLHRMTQGVLAGELGLASHGHISLLERNLRSPSVDLVLRASDSFNVTTDYLLRDSVPWEAIALHTREQRPERESRPRLFGTKLRYLRETRNLTQAELAQQLLLWTQSHISLLEADRSEPSVELVVQLADFFLTTTDYLLRDSIPVEAAIPKAETQQNMC